MQNPIRLSDFINQNMEVILTGWEAFARTINPPALTMDSTSLRDHAELMLNAIAKDLDKPQTQKEQSDKSKDLAPRSPNISPAEKHAEARLLSGFTIGQLFSEYRALRASVLHLWHESSKEGLVSNPEDITRFNEAIDQAIAESLSRYSKLLKTSQDMFLAILGHDLRNPLSTTSMSAIALMRFENVSDKIVSTATRIYNSSQRMSKLINDLMDYTRTQLGKKLPVDLKPSNLAKICADIVEEQQIANPEHSIVLSMEGTFEGKWDDQRIAQVFSNLLGNAIQYGVTSSPVQVHLSSSLDAVFIKINNKGQPIPPSKIQHIFDPLVRHEENAETIYAHKSSLGLGLYISKEIVLAHNGSVNVSSSAADGTTFEIELPR
jgi:signal transduction histidine kinase